MAMRGDRVKLIYCSDPYTKLVPGSEGTVSMIDDVGTVHVKWDSGAYLGMVPGEDQFQVLVTRHALRSDGGNS